MKSGLYIHVCFFPYWLKKIRQKMLIKEEKKLLMVIFG